MPKYISIYNMHIAYQKPGFFRWLPISKWRDFDHYFNDIGLKRKFKFKTTDSVYKISENHVEVDGLNELDCPIFFKNNSGHISIFYNGKVVPKNNFEKELFDNFVASMMHSVNSIQIEQKCNRMIILNNHLGLHARDLFEEPLYKSPEEFTRVFFRSVSMDALEIAT